MAPARIRGHMGTVVLSMGCGNCVMRRERVRTRGLSQKSESRFRARALDPATAPRKTTRDRSRVSLRQASGAAAARLRRRYRMFPKLIAVLGVDSAGLDGLSEGLVVAVVLFGVGLGEGKDRSVETSPLPRVGGDGDAIARAGVRVAQRYRADLPIDRERTRVH
jgi:hypothetical protein